LQGAFEIGLQCSRAGQFDLLGSRWEFSFRIRGNLVFASCPEANAMVAGLRFELSFFSTDFGVECAQNNGAVGFAVGFSQGTLRQ